MKATSISCFFFELRKRFWYFFYSIIRFITHMNFENLFWVMISTEISRVTICSLDVKAKSFPDLEPVCCSMYSSNCCFLTCMKISQEAGQVVWYFHLFQNFLQFIVIHTVKGFGIVNKTEVDGFLEFSCFFDEAADVGNLISGSSAFSKTSLNIRKFTVHILLKPGLENFEHYFARVWNECNCVVVWIFFGIAFLWD